MTFHRIFLLVLLLSFSFYLFSQDDYGTGLDPTRYYIGYGEGDSDEKAYNNALQAMFNKISLSIESSFKSVETESNENGVLTSNVNVESVVKSYSQMQNLQNVQDMRLPKDGDVNKVVCYVRRSDVNSYFEDRRLKLTEYLRLAEENRKESNLDIALKYYYYSYCLLNTIPEKNVIRNRTGKLQIVAIPDLIMSIFRDIKVYYSKVSSTQVKLLFYYKDKPVSRLGYSYHGGHYVALDGEDIITVSQGTSFDRLRIKCDYQGIGETQFDDEIDAAVKLMTNSGKEPFPSSEIFVKPMSVEENDALEVPLSFSEQATIGNREATLELLTEDDEDLEHYSKVMASIVKAIKNRNYSSVYKYFTPEGKDMFSRLISYGNARIVTDPDFAYVRHGDEVICRSLKMSFSFKNNTRKFVESVSFLFDGDGLIDNVSFGLGDIATAGILLNESYTEEARIMLTQFLENYKTAFALKRLDYIRSIFDDNAKIITGTVIKAGNYRNDDDKRRYLENKNIQINRYSKDQYLEKLERTFNSNEFVNIQFAENHVSKGSDGELYCVEIKQDYFSSRYGDTGYLLLLVDMTKPDEPLIKVRTWSPRPTFECGDF